MGLLDALEKVFDINFAPDIDINNVSLINYDGIDGVVDNLEDEFVGIDIEQWQTGEDHHVRIRPYSVGQIS